MDLGIRGRRAAVGGGSAGLGRGCAAALLAAGARVAICGRDTTRLEKAAEQLGPGAVPIRADLSSADGAVAFVERARSALGGLDILVPNAGGPPPGTFESTELDAYRNAIELNLLSTVAMCQSALPAMREAGWGRVVAITSSGVRAPIPFLIASSTTRAGVTSFLKVLASEVAPDGVTVNSVQPGIHDTDRVRALGDVAPLRARIPVGRLGSAEDFGQAVAFLCSEQAGFITGTSLLVDGGQSTALP